MQPEIPLLEVERLKSQVSKLQAQVDRLSADKQELRAYAREAAARKGFQAVPVASLFDALVPHQLVRLILDGDPDPDGDVTVSYGGRLYVLSAPNVRTLRDIFGVMEAWPDLLEEHDNQIVGEGQGEYRTAVISSDGDPDGA